jgi:isovaleryl-CoA dehydrogenase
MINLPGVQFMLGEDIEMLRDAVATFAAKEITPRAAEVDRTDQFPMDLWKKFGDLGVLGMTVSEEYGGANMGYRRTWSRWRRSRAPRRRSACPTARTRTCA